MSEIESLEEIAAQNTLRMNEGTRRGGKGYRFNISANLEHAHRRHHDRGYGVSVGLSHAKVARDPKPPAPRPSRAKPKRQPRRHEVAPAIDQPSIEINGRPLAIIADYDGLWAAIRARVAALQITRETLNGMANLQDGYIGKLLGGAQVKKFGKQSLGKTLEAIGCDLALIEDEIQAAKVRVIDHIFSAAAAALEISRADLARLAGLRSAPPKAMSAIDAALASAGCRLALVEKSEATAKIMAKCEQRKRPVRPTPRPLTGPGSQAT
jgi:hypothetical protein